jgi:hypothetical protein
VVQVELALGPVLAELGTARVLGQELSIAQVVGQELEPVQVAVLELLIGPAAAPELETAPVVALELATGLAAALELERDPVVALALDQVVVALRIRLVTAARHRDLVLLLAAEEDLEAAVAETTRELAAAEAVIAWEVAE